MKISVRIVQVIVGTLFILSGLVKANDPLGLAYKMQEFFELWSSSLHTGHFFAKNFLVTIFDFLHEHALFLSVTMITLEVMTGVALIIGWKKKFILYFLLVLIVFFSFLTGYAYLSGKFTNCGCFGDCLPITPITSFLKDLTLLVMIILLIIGRKYISPPRSKLFTITCLIFSITVIFFFQWYVLKYLPVADCLPFKKGNNIEEQTKVPKNGKLSIYESRLIYKNIRTGQLKDMSENEFMKSGIMQDSSWEWQETKTKLIQKGDDPAINGFSLVNLSDSSNTDKSKEVLDLPYVVLYFVNPDSKDVNHIDKDFFNDSDVKKLPVYIVSSSPQDLLAEIAPSVTEQILKCDGTIFKMAARTNPTIYLLRKGTIINKWPLTEKKKAIQYIHELKP